MDFTHGKLQIYYEVAGVGEPLVLSHAICRDCSQLQRYVGEPAGYQVIRWDAPGHGRTYSTERDYSLNFDSFSELLADLLAYLKIGKAILGGISMGAATTVTYCCRWPERVRAAILIRPAWLAKPHPPHLEILEFVGWLLMKHTIGDARDQLLASSQYQCLQNASPAAAAQILENFEHSHSMRHMRLMQIPASAPIRDWREIAACTMPALVVGSTNDPFHPFDVARQWAERWPNAKLVSIPSALEEPQTHTIRLRHAIGDFLRSLESVNAV